MKMDPRWGMRTNGKGKAHVLNGIGVRRESLCGAKVRGLNLTLSYVNHDNACVHCCRILHMLAMVVIGVEVWEPVRWIEDEISEGVKQQVQPK